MDINQWGYWSMDEVLTVASENHEPLKVDAPLEYNTDSPIYMSDGKVVLVIKTLDGDVEI